MPHVNNQATGGSGITSPVHVETNDTPIALPTVSQTAVDTGHGTIIIGNPAANQKPQTDGFIANTTGFTNRWTGWSGQNGPSKNLGRE